MRTSKAMQEIITQIADRHGLDLSASEAHLRLEQRHLMPLVIEKIGPHLVSVAHYFRQNGDAVADPDLVFFIGYGDWVPIEIQQPFGYQCVATLNEDGNALLTIDARQQADIAEFCDLWAQNLKDQGWLEQASTMAACGSRSIE